MEKLQPVIVRAPWHMMTNFIMYIKDDELWRYGSGSLYPVSLYGSYWDDDLKMNIMQDVAIALSRDCMEVWCASHGIYVNTRIRIYIKDGIECKEILSSEDEVQDYKTTANDAK